MFWGTRQRAELRIRTHNGSDRATRQPAQIAQLWALAVGPMRRRMVPRGRWLWMVPWRWWYRLDARCLVRPHQQHGTRGVVDDEASGGAQAVRTETRTITVASHNQELYPLCYCADDLALYPPPTMNKLRILPSEPRCRGFQYLQGLLVLDLFETSDRVLRDVPLRRTLTCGVHTQGSGCGTERRVPPD